MKHWYRVIEQCYFNSAIYEELLQSIAISGTIWKNVNKEVLLYVSKQNTANRARAMLLNGAMRDW